MNKNRFLLNTIKSLMQKQPQKVGSILSVSNVLEFFENKSEAIRK